MKKSYWALLVLTAVIVIFGATAMFGSVFTSVSGDNDYFDSCRNVKFRVINQRGIAIRLKKIKYYNADEQKWYTEDINGIDAHQNCEPGDTCRVSLGEDLRDAESDHLSKIIFVYEEINNSTTRESPTFIPTSSVCKAEKEYGFGQGWTITGSSPAPPSNGHESDSISDACKNVSFVVANSSRSWIKIDKVKYYNSASGKWKTEDVQDEMCSNYAGYKCTVGGHDNLADANNDDITKIIFIYAKEKNDFNWEGHYESKQFVPESPKCREEKVYGLGQGWTIN